MELPEEYTKEIEEEVGKLGEAEKDSNNCIAWDFFLKAKEVCDKIHQKIVQEKSVEFLI